MKSSLLAAGWEPLIPFAIFFGFLTLSILHALWKRSQRSSSDESWGRPSESAEPSTDSEGRPVVGRYIRSAPLSPPAPATFSPPPVTNTPRPLSPWEVELERVLGRTAPTASPPPLPSRSPAVPPPPVVAADWRSANRETAVEELLERDLESAPMPSAPLASLARAESAYVEASNLAERARGFLQTTDARVVHAVPTQPRRRHAQSAELAAFIAGFHQRATARQAVLATVILGRPKALET